MKLRTHFLFAMILVPALSCAKGDPIEASERSEPKPIQLLAPESSEPPVVNTAQAISAQQTEPDSGVVSDEDLEQHVEELKATLPRGFKIFVQKPFVIIGNESRDKVRQRAHGTVRGAVERLKKDYFKQDPDHIIDVWLFADGPSYRKWAKKLFGHTPETPYGYYSEEDKAMIMNIGTGAGTLVHEIVHPYMAANFPGCPAWFNEGMGSLYEHSTVRNGHIWGLTNWRLTGLQRAIRHKDLPSFEVLTAQTEYEFYMEDPGTNYPQSRYLLQYLQEKQLLVAFYKKFHTNRLNDPTGFETLKEVLGVDDMTGFEKKWKRWVSKLSLPAH